LTEEERIAKAIKGEGEFLREISAANRIQQSHNTSLCSATNAVAEISGKWLYNTCTAPTGYAVLVEKSGMFWKKPGIPRKIGNRRNTIKMVNIRAMPMLQTSIVLLSYLLCVNKHI
jgi:hypothetical protein